MQLLLGFLLASLIGFFAYRRGSLSKSGVVGAIFTGTIIFGLGGWGWGLLLVAFFVSSSALSHFKEARKTTLSEKFSKGHQRDLAQALANGGVGVLIMLVHFFWPHPMWWVAFAGAFATVNADTWATELGVLSSTPPRSILTGQIVETGTSGGLTWLGTMAASSGAAFIALIAMFFADYNAFFFLLIVASAGLLGSLADSFLGATAQAIYFCDHCQKETERHPHHTCGQTTRRVRGWRWLDNDGVNFLSSLVGAGLAAGMWRVLQ